MKRILILLFTLSLILPGVTGQTLEKKQYKATKVSVAPTIDGILDDEAWKEGAWAGDFIQNQPLSGRPATQRTEFKILFDENDLYVAIKAYDTSPDSIVNRLTRRDQADGDLVGIVLDSFHDLRTGFLFGVSSAGVKYDQMFTNDGQNQNSSWDPNWWVKTSINKEGWIAEMRIPFSQVRFEKKSGDVWGMDIVRLIYRNNEQDFWQHIPKDAPGLVHLFGEITGLEQIKPRKIFDVTPYGVAKEETFQSDPNNPFLGNGRKFSLNAGVDAKIGVTNNMTMDLTVNPDFGQVEADPSQVNLSAYETYFTEKRPFFIEGDNITSFNIGVGNGSAGNDNIFYSRRIGRPPQIAPDVQDGAYTDIPKATPIIGATKLTGKTKDGFSLGFIEALTAEVKAKIDYEGERSSQTVEPLTNYLVGRVQKDYNEGKTIIGGMFTGTDRDLDTRLANYLNKSAYSGGFDFTQYFNNKNWMFNLNAAFSQVKGSKKAMQLTQESSAHYFQRPDNNYMPLDTNRTSLFGSGGRMELMKLNGHWNYLACITWKTPGFEINDLGYMTQADQMLSVLWAGYNQFEPKDIYKTYNINGDFFLVNDFGGDITGKGFEWNASMSLKNYWSIWTGGNINGASFSTGMLRGGPLMKLPGSTYGSIGFSTDFRKKFTFDINLSAQTGFEKYYWNLNAAPDLSYKPTNYISFTLSPAYNKSFSELQYVTELQYNNNNRYIFGSIDRKTYSASLRVNFNLSPDLTFQYWGQPFVGSGKYYNYKYITNPVAVSYKDRFHTYTSDQILLKSDNNYHIYENADGNEDYSFANMNFNYQFFLSNLVIRWEYSPGSSLYLVWSQQRSGYNDTGNMDFFNNMGDLFNKKINVPYNVFLIKFSYRFGLK